jgi:hypothetical protein
MVGAILLLLLSGELTGGTLVGAFTGLLDIVDFAICEKGLDGQKVHESLCTRNYNW